MRFILLLFCFFLLLTPLAAVGSSGVNQAIRLSYNFQFDQAKRLLESHRQQQPADPEGYIGQIIIDFLQLQQDPRPAHFEASYANLEKAEALAKQLQPAQSDTDSDFFFCIIHYYYMKTYSLDKRWLATVASANRSRKLALDLEAYSQQYPDVLFILGDQDYTATLVPGYLKPLFQAFNFRAERAEGLNNIRQALEHGLYTRFEAAQLYITLTTYIEKDYSSARASAEQFLVDFPNNLSVQFMYIDILLRQAEISRARELLASSEQSVRVLPANSKWHPRLLQMQGNQLNAQGMYRQAIARYQEAMVNPNISAVSVGEMYLEIGKLYDILGERRSAQAAYRDCEKSDGLEVHKEEARQYVRNAWPKQRASY
ncbi:MAG: hypothetical protein KKI09_15970 [Spirochaetes bacterium]|nr:hypothetical protein [Spirochaetota bacterium]MBU0956920.1 hypothetical protein [Spirochaetota bacterium]